MLAIGLRAIATAAANSATPRWPATAAWL